MTIASVRPRAQETLERMSVDLYRTAYTRGMSLSAMLELDDPSTGYGDGLDAFERVLRAANIRTQSMPEIGIYSDSADVMLSPTAPENVRSLFGEWAARQWRRGKFGTSASTRTLHTIADYAPGSSQQPWTVAMEPRGHLVAPAIPLSELIAITSPIQGSAYEAFYVTEDSAAERMVRVAEGTEIPRAKVTGGDQTIKLRKYGRTLEATYEFMRRSRLDWLSLHIQRMAARVESDKVLAVLSVIENGDGNSGTAATTYNLTTLDSSTTSGVMTLKAWLAFKMKFANPYTMTTALTQEAHALDLMLLNAGSANIPAVQFGQGAGFGMFRNINSGLADGVGLGWLSGATANRIVAVDRRLAVERVTEIGAELQELQRWTTRQVETLTLSEVEGYKVFDQSASAVLILNA